MPYLFTPPLLRIWRSAFRFENFVVFYNSASYKDSSVQGICPEQFLNQANRSDHTFPVVSFTKATAAIFCEPPHPPYRHRFFFPVRGVNYSLHRASGNYRRFRISPNALD
jgi:hypothetical protein